MRALKSNMKNSIITGDKKILHCPLCGGEWSGNRGDYWNIPENHVFTCSECGVELELVEKHISVSYSDPVEG